MRVSCVLIYHLISVFFFFNDTATTEIYTLSLHDALPIFLDIRHFRCQVELGEGQAQCVELLHRQAGRCGERDARLLDESLDRKSTRLNSSHGYISYAVFCLKKKKNRDNCGAVW